MAAQPKVLDISRAEMSCKGKMVPTMIQQVLEVTKGNLSCDGIMAWPMLLALGVMSTPNAQLHRSVVREQWTDFRRAGISFGSCFIVGDHGTDGDNALRNESVRMRDVLLLDLSKARERSAALRQHAVHPRHERHAFLQFRAAHEWETKFGFWRVASRRFPRAQYIALADSDSYVHLPTIEWLLHRLSCWPRLHLGQFHAASFDWRTGLQCAWGWVVEPSKSRKCQMKGAPPMSPFAVGAFRVVSADLARWLTGSRVGASLPAGTKEFVGGSKEDRALGSWLLNTSATYVNIDVGSFHNLACSDKGARGSMFKRVPTAGRSVIVHTCKTPQTLQYVHRILGLHSHSASNSTCCQAKWGAEQTLVRACKR